MSLQVWLPLNGDLHNQGCTDYTITAFEASPTFTAGKIEQCYQRANTSSQITNGLQIQDNLVSTFGTAASVAVWVKPLGTHTHYNGTILSSGDWNRKRWAFGVSQDNSQVDVLCGGYNNYISCPVPVNQWTHLVSTFENGVCKLYKNGVYVGEKSGQAAFDSDANWTGICRETYAGGYFGFNGCINDLRIYDHCLSAAEVREIAQGLVLHYKLDNTGPNFGNPNLLLEGMTPTAAGNGATGIVRSIEDGIQKVVADNPNSNWCTFGNHNTTLALTKGDTFTFSLMIRSPDSNKKPTVYFQSGLGYYGMQGTMSNDWSIIYYTGTWSIDNLQTNLHLGFSSAPGTYYIKYFKLEKGDSATPWAPKTGEPLSNLNYVEDNSGYNHNGTITGTITVENNSPRYSISSYFNGSSYILTPAGSFAWNDLTQLTFAAWMKPTASMTGWRGSVGIAADTSQVARGIAITDYGNEFRGTYTNGSTYVTVATGKTLTQNEWHHCAGTLNGTEFKLYFDGELVKTQAIDWGTATLNTGARFEVGVDLPGSDEKFTGNYSDIRCYCTTLTADDILQLYHTSAKVDNKQNFHTFELVENNSVIKINKRGQTLCNELEEDTATKFYKTNQIIETNEFIEL